MIKFLADFPAPYGDIVYYLLFAIILLSFIAFSVMFFIWLERKLSARMQDRLGPTRTGGKFGWLQSLADTIKLLTKEDTKPALADGVLFYLAPYVSFAASFAAFLVLPLGSKMVGYSLPIAAFFMLSILSSEVFGVILAGYASAGKWSLFGGIREAAQVVSYEIPRGICLLLPVLIAGSFDLTEITSAQSGPFWNWFIFYNPFTFIGFIVFFICITASCKRAPFDLAEAESELVAGFHTEYSGLRWSFFFMAEYASMFAMSALASILFLGGWHCGLIGGDEVTAFGSIGYLLNLICLVGKSWFLIAVMMWMRWSLPRIRIDQVMMICFKYLLPISCFLLIGDALWLLLFPTNWQIYWQYAIAFTMIFVKLSTILRLFTSSNTTQPGKLPGAWQNLETPLMYQKLHHNVKQQLASPLTQPSQSASD